MMETHVCLFFLALHCHYQHHSVLANVVYEVTTIPQSVWAPNQTFTGISHSTLCSSICAQSGQCQFVFNASENTCQLGTVSLFANGTAPHIDIYYKVQVANFTWSPYSNWSTCAGPIDSQHRNRTCFADDVCSLANYQPNCPGDAHQIEPCEYPYVALLGVSSSIAYPLVPPTNPPSPLNQASLPLPPAAFAGFESSYNFYRSGTLYACGAWNVNLVISFDCYAWTLGDTSGGGFVKQANMTMLYVHIQGAAVDMGEFYLVLGGVQPNVGWLQKSEYWSSPTSEFNGTSWQKAPNLPGSLNCPQAVAYISPTQFMVIGGFTAAGPGLLEFETWIYTFQAGNVSNGKWNQTANFPTSGSAFRYGGSAGTLVYPDGKSYVVFVGGMYSSVSGQSTEDFTNNPSANVTMQGDKYDIAASVWIPFFENLTSVRTFASAVVVNNQMWLLGGRLQAINGYNDNVDVLTPGSGWSTVGQMTTPMLGIVPAVYNVTLP